MTPRHERCVRCGVRWNVSAALDLRGKVYICPECVRQIRKQHKKSRAANLPTAREKEENI